MTAEAPLQPTPGSSSTFRVLLLGAGILCIAIVALLVPIPFKGRATVALGDLVHAPLFGGLALAVLLIWNHVRPLAKNSIPMLRRCVLVGFLMFGFGLTIEFVQSAFGRTGNLGDAVNNGLGITAALICYWAWNLQRRQRTRWMPRAMFVTAGMLMSIAWWIPVTLLHDTRAVYANFPMLADFETRIQLSRFYFRECRGNLSRQDTTDGGYSMEVNYEATPYPAATLIELQGDWSSMKTLEVDATLDESYPDADVRFMLKVIDELHATPHTDTFRREWKLERGKTTRISVTREDILAGPDDRETDLTRVQYVDLMLLEPVEPTKVRFDALHLTQ